MEQKSIQVSVLGIGGCGGNILADVYADLKDSTTPITYRIMNTDVQALSFVMDRGFPKDFLTQIGGNATRGLGAGSNPDVGRSAAQEDITEIRSLVTGKDLVIVITGLGGGTGSGATPVILKEAKEANALTMCCCVMPYSFESAARNSIAKKALKEIAETCDAYLAVSNDAAESLVFKDVIKEINSSVSQGIQVTLDVLLNASLVNLDFADFTTVIKNGGKTYFSYACFDGDKRDEKIVKELTRLKLYPGASLKKIQRAVIFVRGGSDMRKEELKTIVNSIQEKLSEDVLVLMGVSVKESKSTIEAAFVGVVGN